MPTTRLCLGGRLLVIPAVFLAAIGTSAQAAPAAEIAFYKFESSGFLSDSSGNGRHLFGGNPSSWTPTPSPSSAPFSNSSQSALFDGVNDILRTVDPLDLSSFQQIRATWWMRPNNAVGVTGIAFEHSTDFNGNVGGFMCAVENAPSGGLTGAAGLRTPSSYNIDAFSDDPPGQWRGMDLTIEPTAGRRQDVVRVSVDGALTPSGNYGGFSPNDLPALRNDWLLIGGRAAPSTFFRGEIDELRIRSEVRLLAWWRFEPGAAFLKDSSPAGNDLVVLSGQSAPASTSPSPEATGTGAALFSGQTILQTRSQLDLSGLSRIRVSAWVRVDSRDAGVVWEHGPSFPDIPGSVSLTINDGEVGRGLTGVCGSGSGASRYSLDKYAHDDKWRYQVVDIDLNAATPQVVDLRSNGMKDLEFRSEDQYNRPETTFLRAAFNIGGRAQGQLFRFRGALDELKIEALSDAAPPPVKPTQLYVLAGQSNALGEADSPVNDPSFSSPQHGAWVWNQGAWYSAQPGFGWTETKFGPEVSFAQRMRQSMPDSIGVIKMTVGATTLQNHWSAPNGVHYKDLLRAISLAKASVPGVEIAGVLWMQGESDALEGYAGAYQQNLTNFINRLRQDLGKPTLRVIVGQIASVWGTPSSARTVMNAQAAVVAALPNVRLVVTDDLSRYPVGTHDDLHYDEAGMRTLGQRFADCILAP